MPLELAQVVGTFLQGAAKHRRGIGDGRKHLPGALDQAFLVRRTEIDDRFKRFLRACQPRFLLGERGLYNDREYRGDRDEHQKGQGCA